MVIPIPIPIPTTPYQAAMRYLGHVEERANGEHPLIQWWLELCRMGRDQPDEVAWCSAFVNGIAWQTRRPRSYKANARSWLDVGTPVQLEEATPGFDVVVFWRGKKTGWKGHVGFYAGQEGSNILVLGGNQGNRVCIAPYPKSRLLGCRRLMA